MLNELMNYRLANFRLINFQLINYRMTNKTWNQASGFAEGYQPLYSLRL